ncbi:UbiE/COQ5 family methyltransferase [Thozetella sp. PMI_491]|nr:UbiE/COQ5 family methyltransferase [Thozetella sp. PMI_491]
MSSDSDARFWDKASGKYSKSPIADQAGYERTLDKTRHLLSPDASVLELGCGTGGTAMHLASGVRCYLGTDISPKMIEIANSKNVADEMIPALEFRTATAESLAVDAETETAPPFDAVLAFNYLHLVRDLPGTLRSINKLLVPDGLFISKTPCVRDMKVGLIFLPLLPLMRFIGLAPFVTVFSAEEVRKQIEAADFEIVAMEYHATGNPDTRPYIVAKKAMA